MKVCDGFSKHSSGASDIRTTNWKDLMEVLCSLRVMVEI